MTKADKTYVLLSWLVQEREDPTEPYPALGGGYIDSGYIQAQLIKAMVEVGDLVVVLKTASDTKMEPTVRDAVRIALGLMGDRRQIPNLLRILETEKEADFRAEAASALGSLGARDAVGALECALNDQFARGAGYHGGQPRVRYTVREAAEVALRVIRSSDPALAKYRREKIEAFERRFAEAQKQLAAGATRETHEARVKPGTATQ